MERTCLDKPRGMIPGRAPGLTPGHISTAGSWPWEARATAAAGSWVSGRVRTDGWGRGEAFAWLGILHFLYLDHKR